MRLMETALAEQHDEWQVIPCYFSVESLATVVPHPDQIPLFAFR